MPDIRNINDNVIYERVKVFLEGIEIPFYNLSVSYGITSLPSCTITLTGAAALRELPPDTKILIIYKNPQDSEDDPWYVLFDGEFGSISYNITSAGAYMTISGIHASTYLHLLQILTQEAYNPMTSFKGWAGDVSGIQLNNIGISDVVIFKGLFDIKEESGKEQAPKRSFKNMSELVYCLLHAMLNPGLFTTGSAAFYFNKMLKQGVRGYMLGDRIAEIDESSIATCKAVLESVAKLLNTSPAELEIHTSSDGTTVSTNKQTGYHISTTEDRNPYKDHYDISGLAGTNWYSLTEASVGKDHAVYVGDLKVKSLDGLQDLADYYKGKTGEDLLVTCGTEGYHLGNEHSNGDATDLSIENPEVRADFIKYAESKGCKVIDEYLIKTAKSTGGHVHIEFPNYNGNTKFKGFKN